ncbi:MAG TPA: hypothetical protein VK927_02980, partial [Adhaeribacter sp.]|nr:hypothetical protein [Adhaeribacter sp.]
FGFIKVLVFPDIGQKIFIHKGFFNNLRKIRKFPVHASFPLKRYAFSLKNPDRDFPERMIFRALAFLFLLHPGYTL